MDLVNACAERESLGGGSYRSVLHLKPVAYYSAGSYYRSSHDWVNGDATYPHVVDAAPFKMRVKADGSRRIHPTREDDRYIEFGAPCTWQVNRWRVVNLGTATRLANKLSWSTSAVDYLVTHAGHFTKLDIPFKAGYLPPTGRIAFPLTLVGLTLSGRTILREGVAVGSLREPYVYDAADTSPLAEHRPIALSFLSDGGVTYAVYTLPVTTGMTSPVADPTFEVQPDAAAGKDTTFYSSDPTFNYGVRADMGVGDGGGWVGRTLIAFSLATVPESATLTSTTLSLYALADFATNNRAARVYRTKRAWVEGTRDQAADSPATGATWNRYDTTSNWQTAGGFGSDDCEQTDIGSRDTGASEALNEFKDWSLAPTTKAALDLGNGWFIKCDTESNDFHSYASSDHATAGSRPRLTVVYTTGGVVVPQTFMHYARLRAN